jgi:hypothetical protein
MRESTDRLLLLQDASGKFHEDMYRRAAKVVDTFSKQRVSVPRKHVLNSLMTHLRDQEMLPAIAFVFSRKQVEVCARDITVNLLEFDSKVPYIARRECEQIVRRLPNFQEYLKLPEYDTLVGLLEKGVGIHHAGMLPVLREIVELFISKRYIKLLVCTETFSIGLDCPIRTAIFTSIYKYDGKGGNVPRQLYAHEYAQAAGRAGRRGLDTVGHVVHCGNLFDLPTATDYRAMMNGRPQTLVSKFKIAYGWILNLVNSGHASRADWGNFVKRSMAFDELQRSLAAQRHLVQEIEARIAQHRAEMDTDARTASVPSDVCRRYLQLMTPEYTVLATLKRKLEADKEREKLVQGVGVGGGVGGEWDKETFAQAVAAVHKMDVWETDLEREEARLDDLEHSISGQLDAIARILVDDGFMTNDGEKWVGTKLTGTTLTERGQVAAAMAEIHPLVMARLWEETTRFQDYDVDELIGWLAMFTDIKVSGGEASTNDDPGSSADSGAIARFAGDPGSRLAGLYSRVVELYEHYRDEEHTRGLCTGIVYDGAVQTTLVAPMMTWATLTTEPECQRFVQVDLVERGISLGDFSKAVLKISAIVKELTAMAESRGEAALGFVNKMSQIDARILKYVVMNQSLYV